MPIFRNIILVAALSGLVVGLLVTVAQQFGTVPLILKAEVYEQAEAPAPAAHAAHEHDQDAGWAPQDGLQRNGLTAVANILTAVGFGLLLVTAYTLRGRTVGWREGLLWGLAGFVAFTVAPSLGLPPELPGMPAAALGPRQLWWLATVAATAIALGLLAFRASPLTALAAVVLMVAPHLFGAPQPGEAATLVPEALAHQFVVAVTVTSFVFWVLLGSLTGLLYERSLLGRAAGFSRAA